MTARVTLLWFGWSSTQFRAAQPQHRARSPLGQSRRPANLTQTLMKTQLAQALASVAHQHKAQPQPLARHRRTALVLAQVHRRPQIPRQTHCMHHDGATLRARVTQRMCMGQHVLSCQAQAQAAQPAGTSAPRWHWLTDGCRTDADGTDAASDPLQRPFGTCGDVAPPPPAPLDNDGNEKVQPPTVDRQRQQRRFEAQGAPQDTPPLDREECRPQLPSRYIPISGAGEYHSMHWTAVEEMAQRIDTLEHDKKLLLQLSEMLRESHEQNCVPLPDAVRRADASEARQGGAADERMGCR